MKYYVSIETLSKLFQYNLFEEQQHEINYERSNGFKLKLKYYVSIETLSKLFQNNLFEEQRHEINYERSNGAVLSGSWQGKKGYVSIETLPKRSKGAVLT